MIKRLLNTKIAKLGFLLMEDFEKTDFQGICSQMAFYLLMAFFPLLIFLISFVGKFVNEFATYLDQILLAFLPDLSYAYVSDLLASLTSQISDSNYFLILISFFFATLAVRAIMTGLNQTYGSAETRSHLKIWILSFLFTLLFALAIVLIAVAYVFSLDIGKFIFQIFGISSDNYPSWQLFALAVSWLLSTLFFNLVYIMAPAKPLKFSEGLPGAIFTTLGLNVAFRIFTWIINNSGTYSTLYGNLGGLFALLVGLYFICVILNLGGKINLYWSIYKRN
ncbi:MAG TPA: YihY/virulence factor BrkB family protein [Acetobacterium sp.]